MSKEKHDQLRHKQMCDFDSELISFFQGVLTSGILKDRVSAKKRVSSTKRESILPRKRDKERMGGSKL